MLKVKQLDVFSGMSGGTTGRNHTVRRPSLWKFNPSAPSGKSSGMRASTHTMHCLGNLGFLLVMGGISDKHRYESERSYHALYFALERLI